MTTEILFSPAVFLLFVLTAGFFYWLGRLDGRARERNRLIGRITALDSAYRGLWTKYETALTEVGKLRSMLARRTEH